MCQHTRTYVLGDHYPLQDPTKRYRLCPQCGMMTSPDGIEFRHIGYTKRMRRILSKSNTAKVASVERGR